MKTIDNYRLGTWEKLGKQLIWSQLDFVHGMKVLDFGSGTGVTADYFSEGNEVIAVEPSEEMVKNGETEILSVGKQAGTHRFAQMIGGLEVLNSMESGTFDMIFCHNVLEYADEREQIISEFYRLLKPGGKLSVVKHNRAGRVMQMAVLLNNFDHAHELLDGNNCTASKFGAIRYYEDEDIQKWCDGFRLCSTRGIRTFWDLQQNQEIQTDSQWQKKMLELEMRVADREEYKPIAFFHHLILEKGKRLDIEKISDQYKMRLLTEADLPDLYQLCVSNPRYYSYLKCEPDPETLKGELTALPPGKTLEDKYFAGIYRDGRMIAILDLITGYPDPKTAFIGWFMVGGELQGTGIGRGFIAELCTYLKKNGFEQIRLGCIEENAEGRRFWERNGFDYTGMQYSTEHYTVLVLQKLL